MNTRRNWILLTVFTLLAYFSVRWLARYQERRHTIAQPTVAFDIEQIRHRGVLRAIMEYNSLSYFIYKGQRLGFEYELMQQFAASIGVKLEVVLAKTSDDQYNLLNEGKGDIIANGLFANNKVRQQVALTFPYRSVEQVIVQRKTGVTVNRADSVQKSDTLLQSALELSNKVVYVAENSIYYNRLKELSDSFGVNIDVRILSDDRGTDDIIEAVANGEIDYTIANKDIALLNKSYFENLDVNTPVGHRQNLYWAVRNNSPELLNNLNSWIQNFEKDKVFAGLYDKYFNQQKHITSGFEENAMLQQGMISHYDAIIQRYSKSINWDWRLVAAVINQESGFNPVATSWCGAQGLMQLMPGTARQLGVYSRSEVYNPSVNIRAGTQYLKNIEKTWASIPDFTQRVKFILASYNAGVGHVTDAARLAEKFGFPKDKWDGSVEYFMLYKSNPRFYNDEVVKYGYCRGQEPFNYVRNIVKKYFDYQSKINLTSSTQPTAFRLEQVESVPFEGIDGVYNPTQGLIARSARRELFLSHKLFDENELVPKSGGRNPFDKPKTELFVKKDGDTSNKQLFRKQNQLFQQPPPGGNLSPNQQYKINKLIPRKRK
jgi:membrane-bound lytic murein transglycosylase F